MNGIHHIVHIKKTDDFRTIYSSPPPGEVFKIRAFTIVHNMWLPLEIHASAWLK